ASLQRYFLEFHKTIRMDDDLNATLREKRDIIVERLAKYLKKENKPGCDVLLQGSYAYKTGVVPINGAEYDIDVGLRFPIAPKEYTAQQVREWVWNAVHGHTEKVSSLRSCVRVVYSDGYHVDLVSYATWEENGLEQFKLAHKSNGWRGADPKELRAR